MSGVERPERRALLVRGGVWRLPLKLHDHCRSQRGHPGDAPERTERTRTESYVPAFTAVPFTVAKGGNDPGSTWGELASETRCDGASVGVKNEAPTPATARTSPEDAALGKAPVTEGHAV